MEPGAGCVRLKSMHVVETRPTAQLAEPRLARMESSSRTWLTPGYSTSTAFINLSPGLVCVFAGADGLALTHQQVGEAAPSARQLWNESADRLTRRALVDTGVEFLVRCPSAALGHSPLRGYEVDGHGAPAASWLAHPKTFTVLHRHFESVLKPRNELMYVTRNDRDLFVFDAPIAEVRAIVPRASVLTYSVGFPLMHH